jgi:hypothetical protein
LPDSTSISARAVSIALRIRCARALFTIYPPAS